MTDKRDETPFSTPAKSVKLALGKSEQVKVKVEDCATDLSTSNQQFKNKLSQGERVLPAQAVLSETLAVQAKVEECAVELHDVNELLLQGVDDLKRSERALVESQAALAVLQTALESATVNESKALQKALHDGLTGLPNRELFGDRVTQAIAGADRQGWTLALMFIDLDHFKAINDNHGHAAGDAVLKAVADRLLQRCRESDTLCRCGGDEFLFLLVAPDGQENIEHVARALLKSIAMPIAFGVMQLTIEASIGVSLYPTNGLTTVQLIHQADAAMYEAKKNHLGVGFFKTESSPA